jgi:hypothetical protein
MIEANHDTACLNHVNGLYGPGAMLGWYLTLAGCTVSWTMHPHRKQKDSIHADMLTFLLLPLVAAAQMVSISRHANETLTFVQGDVKTALPRDYASMQTCQTRAAIEAPAEVVLVFLTIIVTIYPLSALHHFKRGSALVLVALTCVASQWYIFDFALFDIPELVKPSEFLSEKHPFWLVCSTVIGMDIVQLVEHRFSSRRAKGPGTLESQTIAKPGRPYLIEGRIAMVLWVLVGPLIHDTRLWWLNPLRVSGDSWKIFFPETPYSLRNMEQAVAAMSGAIVLGFNLCSIGILWYKERQARRVRGKKLDLRLYKPGMPHRSWHGHMDDAGNQSSSRSAHDRSKGKELVK